jgi:predicted nucleotidyltransferase
MIDALELAERIAGRLAAVPGVVGVALGGSHASGLATEHSDVDIGIYYRQSPPDLQGLRSLAVELDDQGRGEAVTDFGAWGPWVNGGAWLEIEGNRVDWIYRDLERVEHYVLENIEGRDELHAWPGHPHGFYTHTYAGEIAVCRVLHDPEAELSRLRSLVTPYPSKLRASILEHDVWRAEFALLIAQKSAMRGESFYVAGCLFECVAHLAQAICALNRRFCINEKGSVALADSLEYCPANFARVVSDVLAHPGSSPVELGRSLERLRDLVLGMRKLREMHA